MLSGVYCKNIGHLFFDYGEGESVTVNEITAEILLLQLENGVKSSSMVSTR